MEIDHTHLKMIHNLPGGCLRWLLCAGPDPLWNGGANAMAFRAMERRKLLDHSGRWTELGRAVQAHVRKQRGLR